jgi:Asp-tRNA(Asn)/Glu-tRNA(Gln) amidotransferase A subunit family amidase
LRGRGVSATDYIVALEDTDTFTRAFAGWWEHDSGGGCDMRITPVTGTVTPKLGALGMDSARLKTSMLWWPYCNMAGRPTISLPLHWTDEGCP